MAQLHRASPPPWPGPATMERPLSLPFLHMVPEATGRESASKPLCGEPERSTQSRVPGLGGTLQEEPCGQSCSPLCPGEVALQSPQAPGDSQAAAGRLAGTVRAELGLSCQGCRLPLQLMEKEPHPPPPQNVRVKPSGPSHFGSGDRVSARGLKGSILVKGTYLGCSLNSWSWSGPVWTQ